MGESQNQSSSTSSRLGIRNTGGGEIVEVQGGHIVRSTGRKDRHSKVCTAKGPRDRRVRLSAHTAIQFYDVQDRLGYDRPSKAVDWLIKKAKPAIDELAELPAWHPTATTTNTKRSSQQEQQLNEETEYQFPMAEDIGVSSGSRTVTMMGSGEVQHMQRHHQQHQQQIGENPNSGSSFLPPSLDSDSIADTIKSFFPIGATTGGGGGQSSTIQFQSYPPDLLSRTSSQNQDLRLSLHSFQEPMLLQQHHQHQHHHHHQVHQASAHQNEQQVLFPGTAHLGGFVPDGSSAGWSTEHHHQHQHSAEVGRFQRMVVWNGGTTDATGSGGGGSGSSGGTFMFNSPPPPLQPFFGQNQLFSQRGPLQSSNTPSVRAWIDPAAVTIAAAEDSQHQHHHHHHHHHQISPTIHHQSAMSGIGFTSTGGFSGFRIPARIQGEEEEQHDGIHKKPSSASSDSRH